VEKNLLSLAARRIKEDTLLIVDLSDITKRYAQAMEYMAGVHDGSTGSVGFAAVHLGDSIRLGVLAHHALKEAKRLFGIPDCRYPRASPWH
jgi:hypothetical protein